MVKKSNTIKLSEKQIEVIDSLKKESQELNFQLGVLIRQKNKVDENIKKLEELIADYDQKEIDSLKALQEELGDGHLDLKTYIFTKAE